MFEFLKKEETVESLVKDCNDKYKDFIGHLSKAHHIDYVMFKVQLKENFEDMREKISQTNDEYTKMSLLKSLQKQLSFITEHPFFADNKEVMSFFEEHYPEKAQLIKKSSSSKLRI